LGLHSKKKKEATLEIAANRLTELEPRCRRFIKSSFDIAFPFFSPYGLIAFFFLRHLRVDFDDRPEFFPGLTVPTERVKTMKMKNLLTGKAMGWRGRVYTVSCTFTCNFLERY
jgi:hypothetical protein